MTVFIFADKKTIVKLKKKVYLVRHGQTDNNRKHILQGGNVNVSINETGRLQSQAFFEAYRGVPFKKIYTSALCRSIESVQQFIDLGIPHEAVPELNEISFGLCDGIAHSQGEGSVYTGVVHEWEKGNLHVKLEGGESPLEVQQRLIRFAEHMLQQEEEDPILISMHGRAMRIFLATILNYDLKEMHLFRHCNLGLYVLNYTGSMFSVEKYNDTAHLEKLVIPDL